MTIMVLVFFLLDWFAVAFEWRKFKPLAKILAMVAVIIWTLMGVDWSPGGLVILLLLAQFFGLAGDIFLLFSNRWFLAGLGAFLLGNILYAVLIFVDITHVTSRSSLTRLKIIPAIFMLILWGILLWILYRFFQREDFIRHRRGKLLWKAVQVYIWILSGMVILGIYRVLIQPGLSLQLAFLPIGGVLFLVSDSLLAYNRFVHPVHRGQLWVHVTYHLAQFSLAAGFLMILGDI